MVLYTAEKTRFRIVVSGSAAGSEDLTKTVYLDVYKVNPNTELLQGLVTITYEERDSLGSPVGASPYTVQRLPVTVADMLAGVDVPVVNMPEDTLTYKVKAQADSGTAMVDIRLYDAAYTYSDSDFTG